MKEKKMINLLIVPYQIKAFIIKYIFKFKNNSKEFKLKINILKTNL
jgi:hypothetical protein